MDWLRRNWPDLIIGVALVAVVSLIVVTLLSGGSLASLTRRGDAPELAVTDTTTPGSNTPQSSPAANSDGATDADASGAGTDGGAVDSSANSVDGGVDVFVPGVPGGRPNAVPNPVGQTQAGGAANPAGTQAGANSAGTTQPQNSTAAPVNTGPLPEAVQDGGFRVAAGAVDSRDAAASLAESYRDAGYTVTVEQQNDLYLLWIGPYASRDGAERVANRLITDNVVSDALVYTYSGPDNSASDDNASGAESAAATTENNALNNASSGNETAGVGNASGTGSSPANAATAPATTANNANAGPNINATANAGNNSASANAAPPTNLVTNPAATTGQRYLQVGAFASDESAQPLREQLGALGFNVTQSVSDSGLVRLLVGPFGAAQLAQAQDRLAAQGVTDAFPVIP